MKNKASSQDKWIFDQLLTGRWLDLKIAYEEAKMTNSSFNRALCKARKELLRLGYTENIENAGLGKNSRRHRFTTFGKNVFAKTKAYWTAYSSYPDTMETEKKKILAQIKKIEG